MKKFLVSVVFLSLASIQVLASQSLATPGKSSQFSGHSHQTTAQAAIASNSTAKTHSAKMHAYIANALPSNPVGFLAANQISAGGLTTWSAVSADSVSGIPKWK